MNMRELSSLTDTPERQIRYMIAEGFVPPPEGGRANADYGDEHVAAVRRYRTLRGIGLTPQAIRVLLANGMAAPFPICPGIALHVDAEIVGAVDAVALVERVRQAVEEFM
jgi:MerR family transcriptional regulator, copper efflux regulator